MGQKMPAIPINMNDISKQPRWYTVVTKFNYEQKFATDLEKSLESLNLTNNILEIFVPIDEELVKTTNKKGKEVEKIVQHKVYPAYVFVKAVMNEDVWMYIRKTTGCATILAIGDTPATMEDYEVDKIKKLCRKVKKKSSSNKININDKVKIRFGIFENYLGNVVSINDTTVTIKLDCNGLNIETGIGNVEAI